MSPSLSYAFARAVFLLQLVILRLALFPFLYLSHALTNTATFRETDTQTDGLRHMALVHVHWV